MKSIIFFILLLISVFGKAQSDSILSSGDSNKISQIQKMIIGKWNNVKNNNWVLSFTKDSMVEKSYKEDGRCCLVIKYRYMISYNTPSGIAIGGAPNLINWRGYYIQGWNDSNPNQENFRTMALFSISKKYLMLDTTGEILFAKRRVK